MYIKDVLELINELFYGDFERTKIVDTAKRETYIASDLTVKQLKSIPIDKVDGILPDGNFLIIKI